MPTRRHFLSSSAASLGLLALQSRVRAAGAASPGPLLSAPIPSTGERLPMIGAGTSGSFEIEVGSPQYEGLRQVLKVFFDGGAQGRNRSTAKRGAAAGTDPALRLSHVRLKSVAPPAPCRGVQYHCSRIG